MPIRPLSMVSINGLVTLKPDEITAERVGWKAFGISALPEEWTLPCLVVDADFLSGVEPADADRVLAVALRTMGIPSNASLLIRSSGTAETMRQRGRLLSATCDPDRVVNAIIELQKKGKASGTKVHWIIQEYRSGRALGHFSNERRLSYEKRDWVLEVELRENQPGYSSPVAVRQWRDGLNYARGTLVCSSEARISVCLKQVAMWAHQFDHRLHFEWIWTGKQVLLVQADAEDSSGGVNPSDLLPTEVAKVRVAELHAFRLAGSNDYKLFKKLSNAKLYSGLGYNMPPFYVLDDRSAITSILKGKVPEKVRGDLARMTARPLIIRTDGRDIPAGKREMLPRSDELRSEQEASSWLTGDFRDGIEKQGLDRAALTLIAHHFIPSIASAWARSEPARDVVRVESLWGIPEGLYWFSHDTFEVNTRDVDVRLKGATPRSPLPYDRKLRYKGRFIAPDVNGTWVLHETAPPHDWSASITHDAWLTEIAWRTRQIAEHEKRPVSVMWFLGNHPDASKHAVLPWFHDRSDISDTPKAAPSRKYRGSADFRIRTAADWTDLKTQLSMGKHVERVMVDPSDATLIRNEPFAKELALLAKTHSFAVELSGGILSHAYYILQRHGARVECVDLFGSNEDVIEFNKVVRDKIPAGIADKGERAEVVRLAADALIIALKQKLVEEALEVLDTRSGEDLVAELADVLEVIYALVDTLEVPFDQLEAEREEKKKSKGGLAAGFMLTKTTTPHSVAAKDKKRDPRGGKLKVEPATVPVIADATRLPERTVYRRPDLRKPEERAVEKVLTIEVDMSRFAELKETLPFALPGLAGGTQEFSLVLELKRIGGALRAVVRLRRLADQLELVLDERQLALFPTRSAQSDEESGGKNTT